jgi:pimeloyl-ACP methyl ester carboxylesterase
MFLGERPTPETAYWWRSFPEGFLAESEAIEETFAQGSLTGSLGDRPLVVLVGDGGQRANPDLSAETNAAVRRIGDELRQELAALSTNSDYRIVAGAGHAIHRDRPDVVVAAVRDVVTAVRSSEPVRSVHPAR